VRGVPHARQDHQGEVRGRRHPHRGRGGIRTPPATTARGASSSWRR
jgi:hypothetical protein